MPKKRKVYTPEELEAIIQKSILKYLVLNNYVAIRINSGAFFGNNRCFKSYRFENDGGSSGFPDILALMGDRFKLFEAKKVGGVLRPSQKEFILLARDHNIDVHVVDNLEDVIDVVEGN